MCVRMYVSECVCKYVRMSVRLSVCLFICLSVRKHVCMMYVCNVLMRDEEVLETSETDSLRTEIYRVIAIA